MNSLHQSRYAVLDNLTDWIVPTINDEESSCSCVPLSPFNFTFVLNGPCRLEERDILSKRDAIENSTRYFFSQLYDYYFGSAGRGKFCNMTLPLEKWSLLLPVDLSAASQGRARKHYDIDNNDYLKHRSISNANSDLAQPWQFVFQGEVCFKYEPAPNETLRELILESFLSRPEILSVVGNNFYQSVLPSCGNQVTTPFELVTPFATFSASSASSTSAKKNETNNDSLPVAPHGIDSEGLISSTGSNNPNESPYGNDDFSSNTPVASSNTTSTSPGEVSLTPTVTSGNERTTVTTQSVEGKNNTALILGLVIPILLLIATAIAVVIVHKRKRRNRGEIYDVSKIDYGMDSEDFESATSIDNYDIDDGNIHGKDYIVESRDGAEFHESNLQQSPTSLLIPMSSTTAAVLQASKAPDHKMNLSDYDICAKSAVTEDDASLVVSVPLEEVLNVHSSVATNQYTSRSSQIQELMRSAVVANPAVEVPKNTVSAPGATPAVAMAAGNVIVKKNVSFSEPERDYQSQKQRTSPVPAFSLVSSSYNGDESSRRLTQPSRYVVEEPTYVVGAREGQKDDYDNENHRISMKEGNEGEISLAESSLCMSKKDLISLLAGSRIKMEEDFAMQRLQNTKQSFAKNGNQGFVFNE